VFSLLAAKRPKRTRFLRKENSAQALARGQRQLALWLVGPVKPWRGRVEPRVPAAALRRLPRGAAERRAVQGRLLQQQPATLQPRRVQQAQPIAAEQARLAHPARPDPSRRSRKTR